MNDHYEELKVWNAKAYNFITGLSDDRVNDTMMLAALLRTSYLQGKKDGVKEYNNAER